MATPSVPPQEPTTQKINEDDIFTPAFLDALNDAIVWSMENKAKKQKADHATQPPQK